MEKQVKAPPVCEKHGVQKIRRFNSTITICPVCEREKQKERSQARKQKNNALLKQSHKRTVKVAEKGQKTRKTPRQLAMDRADKYFSIYIRIAKAFKIVSGEVFCRDIITGMPYHAKNIDNGHLFSRSFKSTRYEPDNCWPQNRSSNRFSGEADHYKFQDNVIKLIGQDRFNRLDQLRKQTSEDTLEFYEQQSAYWLSEVNKLVVENNIKKWW